MLLILRLDAQFGTKPKWDHVWTTSETSNLARKHQKWDNLRSGMSDCLRTCDLQSCDWYDVGKQNGDRGGSGRLVLGSGGILFFPWTTLSWKTMRFKRTNLGDQIVIIEYFPQKIFKQPFKIRQQHLVEFLWVKESIALRGGAFDILGGGGLEDFWKKKFPADTRKKNLP